MPRTRPRQDNGPVEPKAPALEPGLGDDIVMSLRFFSRLPTGDRPFSAPRLDRMAMSLPFASLVIGIGPALLLMLCAWAGMPSYFAAAFAVAAMLVATGAMADDALADAADGLFGGSTVERRLEIMKDSRHGTYGVAALALYILLRVMAIGAVAAANPVAAAGIWLASTVIGRSGSLWLSVALPNARASGASATAGRVRKRSFAIGAGFGAVVAVILAGPFTSLVAVILAVVAAGVVATAWAWTCRRLVKGQTGDLIGALGALIEVAVLAILLIFA